MQSIPFNDLSRTPPELMSEVQQAIARVLASGWFVMGPEHNAFESELAAYLGVSHAVAVANGTDALQLALAAVGVSRGDSVVTVANAGGYTSIAARLLGAVPVYCDVDQGTLLMTPAALETALAGADAKPAAIVVTHLFGAMAPIQAITAVARAHGIPVVEDCAQSIGARNADGMSGSFGDIATTSFYPTKNLGALGDGGAVYTNSPELADTVRRMRQYGWSSKYHISYDHGMNSRMDELQAAILRVKLPHLDEANERRRSIHARYEAAAPGIVVGRSSPSFIAHLAVVAVDERDAARAALAEDGIGTDIHYPVPDHWQDFPTAPPAPVVLPATERSVRRILSVPMFPELTDDEADRIAERLERLDP
jgi:aminotransferase EvaB